MMRIAVDGVHQVSCRAASDLFGVVVDAGERRARTGGKHLPIIVSDDGHVVGYAQPCRFQGVDAASRELVALAHHGVEFNALVEQQSCRGATQFSSQRPYLIGPAGSRLTSAKASNAPFVRSVAAV